MAVIENNEKPILYNLYDKLYEYNDLLKAFDQGFSNYIGGLKHGNKRELDYRDAGLNIMAGIKDGSITFQDGRFVDSKARYKNIKTKNKNEDYYGIMANYIYSLMGKSKEYSEPKIVEKTPEKSVLTAMEQAPKEIPKIENSEILELPEQLTLPLEFSLEAFYNYTNTKYGRMPNDSSDFDTNFLDKLGDWTATLYLTLLDNLPDKELKAYFLTAVNNPDLDFSTISTFLKAAGNQAIPVSSLWVARRLIQVLKNRNKLILDPKNTNIFYIPDIIDKDTNSGFYYDALTKTIHKRSVQDIPYWQLFIFKEYKDLTQNDWTGLFFTLYHKEGGIIKAEDGTKLWYSDLNKVEENSFIPLYDLSKLYSIDFKNPYISDIVGAGIGRYAPSKGNDRKLVLELENSNYYKLFGKDLLNEDGTFTDLGLKWAKEVDKLIPKNSSATFFDENGKLRTSWTTTNNDVYGRPGLTFNNLKDYVNYVRNDNILGARHNIFGKTGNRYFYTDNEGNKVWVNPTDLSKYNLSEAILTNKDGVTWNDYEITGLKGPDFVETPNTNLSSLANTENAFKVPKSESEIDLVTGKNKSVLPDWKKSVINGILENSPELLEASKLFDALNTNRKVESTLKDSLLPSYHDPINLYAPVTGDLITLGHYNNQANNVRSKAETPFTSDASLLLARENESEAIARDLENKGLLADTLRRRETEAISLNLALKSAISRVENANYNRDSAIKTIGLKGEIEATRLKSDLLSRSNYLSGLALRLSNYRLKSLALKLLLAMLDLDLRYKDAVNLVDKMYKEKYPNATASTMVNDLNYSDAIKLLLNWRLYLLGKIYLNDYIISNSNPGNLIDITRNISFNKHGSRLIPKKQYNI